MSGGSGRRRPRDEGVRRRGEGAPPREEGAPPREEGALPNVIVIGAMKCGTTSLHRYLDLHPEIQMSRPKELEFFIEERNWDRGPAWYRSRFSAGTRVRGETSPNYSHRTRFPGVPSRMHALLPGARLIYIVRDPIERMISHWMHQFATEREERPAEEALTEPGRDNQYVTRSLYHMQIRHFLDHYDRSQILVLSAERLRRRRHATIRRAYRFLGVDPRFSSYRFRRTRHPSARKRRKTRIGRWLKKTPPMRALRRVPKRYRWPVEDLVYYPFSRRIPRPRLGEEVRAELHERLGEDIERFRDLTGRRFAEWSV